MAFNKSYYLLLGLLVLFEGVKTYAAADDGKVLAAYPQYNTTTLNRYSFPAGFTFGASSSAYQFEGAVHQDGRGPTIWDTFTHKYPEKISDGSNGDVADDQYNRYKEDVGIMKKMGLDAYRFSISWPRILPKGKLSGGINEKGVKHYNDLINELLLHGIQPYITIFHWDLPQSLEDEYGGFLSSHIVKDFTDYADVCFKEFGDRVKYWMTLNEPYAYSLGGYASGSTAPGRCSAWQQLNCTGGDSATEPYIVSHNLLLSHASAVKLYKEKYQANQKGQIGIAHVASWALPYSNAKSDLDATQRFRDFIIGWFLDPMIYGNYPKSMRLLLGRRLPKFTKEQSKMLKGSFDFVGLNYYTTSYAEDSPNSNNPQSATTDPLFSTTGERNGTLIGPVAGSSWLYIYPPGIHDMLLYIKKKYKSPLMIITENGVDEVNNTTLPLKQQLADSTRVGYYYNHLTYLRKAIKDGVNVKGYFAWALLDDYEWSSGFTVRFGLNYVDYKNGLKRYPKHSAIWFKSFLKRSN